MAETADPELEASLELHSKSQKQIRNKREWDIIFQCAFLMADFRSRKFHCSAFRILVIPVEN
jgi:hypothetical protein